MTTSRSHILLPLLILAAISLHTTVHAQFVSVDFDKKVLYTDSLRMPGSTSIDILMTTLPELLCRHGDNTLSNYDIQIAGMSVLGARDATLAQLRISDVERIEVSESPTSSYLNNGQGGVINLILRRKDSGLWGSAALDASYPTDVMPALTLGYVKGQWTLNGIAMGEYYRPHNDVVEWEEHTQLASQSPSTVIRENVTSWNQLARLYTQCRLSPRDKLTWNLGEYTSSTRQARYASTTDQKTNAQYTTNTTLQTLLSYSHTFNPQSSLTAELQYVYSPTTNGLDQNQYMSEEDIDIVFDNEATTHNVNGKLSYQLNFLPSASPSVCNLTLGMAGNGTFTRGQMTYLDRSCAVSPNLYTTRYDTYYLMPFAKLKVQVGRFRLSLSGEFQHLNTLINPDENNPKIEDYTKISDAFTCKLIGEYHFTPRQLLRLIIDRKLQRPSKTQQYPFTTFNPERYEYVRGNNNLSDEGVVQVGMDYVSSYQWGPHRLQTTLAANYYHVSDLIIGYTVGGTSNPDGIGLTQRYLTFCNGGHDNILAGGIMALWQYRRLQVSAAANVYHNKQETKTPQETSTSQNHYTYYNINLQPSITLPRNWSVAANFMYNSRVTRYNQYLGQSSTLGIYLNKTWHHLGIYAYAIVSLLGNATDASVSGDVIHYYRYPQVRNGGGAGIRYIF